MSTFSHKQPGRIRTFWASVTDGLELQQLWGQFKSEAKASYRLYSADVDWKDIEGKSKGQIGRFFRSAWALFKAMLMKLTPARRVLLLLAIALLVIQPAFRIDQDQNRRNDVVVDLAVVGVVILFLLLVLELADRVTMKRDLEIAREIQEWLVPDSPPKVPGIDVAFATRPQNTVAGDYFDAFVRPGKAEMLIAVADVAGKSIPAALLMATFQASLHTLTSTPSTLEEIVRNLDHYCCEHSLNGRRFTTAFLAELNPETREMVYVNAGHNHPILRRASGDIERLDVGGPPFGIPNVGGDSVRHQLGRVLLEKGDLLFVFTDGVVEAVNDQDIEYGEARLLTCLRKGKLDSAIDTLNRVMQEVHVFVGQARQYDDITTLVLRIEP
jgi:sigma-B regulation protein RsbU (phosphoserine phosphatase)